MTVMTAATSAVRPWAARALFWLNGKRKNHLYEHIALYSPAMPIHLCCGLSANLGGLELLLAHAVDVNTARSAMRMTALHFAAMNGHTQIVERHNKPEVEVGCACSQRTRVTASSC